MSAKNEASPGLPHESISMKSMMLKMYACVFGLLIFAFSWMISGECYFNARTYQVLAWSYLPLACIWMVVYTRSLRRRNFMIPEKGKLKRLKPWTVPIYVALSSALLAAMSWIFLYGVACLLVFASSRTETPITTTIDVIRTGGRCPVSYSFFDPPIQRSVHDCGSPYLGAYSGDSARIGQSVGPLGMRLYSVSRVH